MKALVFGCGYLGEAFAKRLLSQGWSVAATSRDAERRTRLSELGFEAIDPSDAARAARDSDAVLAAAPPTSSGCPGLETLQSGVGHAHWIGYLSSTRVYGDRGGGWVFEDSALNAPTTEGARRAAVERAWHRLGAEKAARVHVFRLAAIYGPGRSPFEKLRDGSARVVHKPGQVFNRIHVEDAVSALIASMARPRAGAVYNLADDAPAGADVYVEAAARLLGMEPPAETHWEDPAVSDAMRRFYLDNKRVSNARAKAELGWRPRYPTWREGLKAVLGSES